MLLYTLSSVLRVGKRKNNSKPEQPEELVGIRDVIILLLYGTQLQVRLQLPVSIM